MMQGTCTVPVAVKVLKDQRTEAKRTLLQEAALMGQFYHRNVVKLCGVVTEDEPVGPTPGKNRNGIVNCHAYTAVDWR